MTKHLVSLLFAASVMLCHQGSSYAGGCRTREQGSSQANASCRPNRISQAGTSDQVAPDATVQGPFRFVSDPAADAEAEAASAHTVATFSVMGLHCPPCSSTVSSSLLRAKGIRSAKVDFKTKSARIDFDESVVSAQDVVQLIVGTPHMMGPNMHYNAAISLSVPELKDAESAAKAKEALGLVAGVAKVATYPDKHLVVVHFGKPSHLTSRQLIDALVSVDLPAKTY